MNFRKLQRVVQLNALENKIDAMDVHQPKRRLHLALSHTLKFGLS